jgi:predicted nicotinamide N-methyase
MYLTDIHVPTLENLEFNAKKNNLLSANDGEGKEDLVEGVAPKSVFKMGEKSSVVEVLNLNWKDPSTYPSQTVEVVLGADLVYDSAILQMLVPAIAAILSEGEVMFVSIVVTIVPSLCNAIIMHRWSILVLCS